jgi:heterotetrameric sarcosine oxidase gamma subunit
MAERCSALARSLEAGGRDGARGGRRLQLTEVRGWQLAHLGVFPGHHDECQDRIRACSGMDLPVEPCRGITHGDSRLYRIARDQYWWVAATGASIGRLSRELPPSAGTLTVLSASRVRLRVAGPAARELLAKGIALDLHPMVFPEGHSVQTGLHHTHVLLERVGDDRYEMYVQRTYAVSIWEWLIDAALPFGYDVAVEEVART